MGLRERASIWALDRRGFDPTQNLRNAKNPILKRMLFLRSLFTILFNYSHREMIHV